METEECQYFYGELSNFECEFKAAIAGLPSVDGSGCEGCFQHDAAAIEEEGETEGAAVEDEAQAAPPPRLKKKDVSKKSKAGIKKNGASKKSKAVPKKKGLPKKSKGHPGPKKKRTRGKRQPAKKCRHNKDPYYCKQCGGIRASANTKDGAPPA
jgi:hypothetical protein